MYLCWVLVNFVIGMMSGDSVVLFIVNFYVFGVRDFDFKFVLYYMVNVVI